MIETLIKIEFLSKLEMHHNFNVEKSELTLTARAFLMKFESSPIWKLTNFHRIVLFFSIKWILIYICVLMAQKPEFKEDDCQKTYKWRIKLKMSFRWLDQLFDCTAMGDMKIVKKIEIFEIASRMFRSGWKWLEQRKLTERLNILLK